MSHRLILIAALVAVALSTGCARIGPGGAAPGMVYSNVTYPNMVNPNMDFRITFDRDDIELLGPVHAEAESKWMFFVYSSGDSGYGALMDQARAMGADGVMNITVDTNFKWYLLFYARVTMKLTGQGYRYVRNAEGK